jgi:hypothetical protein
LWFTPKPIYFLDVSLLLEATLFKISYFVLAQYFWGLSSCFRSYNVLLMCHKETRYWFQHCMASVTNFVNFIKYFKAHRINWLLNVPFNRNLVHSQQVYIYIHFHFIFTPEKNSQYLIYEQENFFSSIRVLHRVEYTFYSIFIKI